MSREKNIFEKFPKKWPKGVFARRVGGERGNIDLPSGAKGGEKMDLDRHDEHKQHTFDSFCKKVIRCEAYNAYRAIGRRQDLEIPFSQLPEEAMEALAVSASASRSSLMRITSPSTGKDVYSQG